MGCDGFRVDMAGTLVKNDPEGQGNVRLWRHFRDFLDREFPEAVMISEWGRPELSLLAGFHMDFLLHNGPSHYMDLFRTEHPFFSREGRGDVSEFVRAYEANAALAGKGLICIPSGNHDMSRLAGMLDQEEMKIAFAFLLSMPGAPFLYYGDEIGMRWIDGLPSKEGSRSYRAGSRTPMQWADDLNDGFSDARPDRLYLPLDPTPAHPTAEAQMADPNSLGRRSTGSLPCGKAARPCNPRPPLHSCTPSRTVTLWSTSAPERPAGCWWPAIPAGSPRPAPWTGRHWERRSIATASRPPWNRAC